MKLNELSVTQKNLLFAAGTTAVAAAGPLGIISAFGLLAQPALAATQWTKDRKAIVKVGQAALGAGLSFIAIGVGTIMNPTYEAPTPTVEVPAVEAPAPVVEAPVSEPTGVLPTTPIDLDAPVAEVTETPAPVEVISANDTPWAPTGAPPIVVGGRYTHIQYWVDESPSRVQGDVSYNTDKKSITWTTNIFGTSEVNKCDAYGSHFADGKRTGLQCSTTMAGDRPVQVIITDPTDGYRISKTTFTF